MGELGKEEKELHAQVGTYLSEKNIDYLFCAGELSREMAREAKGNPRCTVEHFSSKEDLIPALLQEVKEGDTILVKASHFMEYPKIIEALRKR